MEMLFAPFVIVMFDPAVSVAAVGGPLDDPIKSCPFAPNAVITGVPVAPVVKTPLFAVASPATVFVEEEYNIWFAVVVEG